ncbi:hypothetical protein ISF_09069 [Cordyceps fumosorosea ARSEF 2679]|uniref:Secreted protein n=1 Tax=Cordyceps fumosorosea (strain ARSEF 2679) TaxID=1081104 RepID=A0A167LEX1_CORFA|nr:hypothetical protein ISF_09069 [Cordyceps fumosorosea ARSEF 2679]OAA53006.1 hypothetical protein ISF_09069 [Cordyceps fumosorosea ARSEF 2679]
MLFFFFFFFSILANTKMPGPSRRVARVAAKIVLDQARRATWVAAEAAFAGRLSTADWRRFYYAELAAEVAFEAILRGFGEFRG